MTTPSIPRDAKPENVFRCREFHCSLTYAACLARRAEWRRTRHGGGKAAFLPRHPYCAESCDQGHAAADRFGAVPRRIRASMWSQTV